MDQQENTLVSVVRDYLENHRLVKEYSVRKKEFEKELKSVLEGSSKKQILYKDKKITMFSSERKISPSPDKVLEIVHKHISKHVPADAVDSVMESITTEIVESKKTSNVYSLRISDID